MMFDLNKERKAFAQTEFNTFGLDVKDFKTTGEYFMFIGWLMRSELEKAKAQAVPDTHVVVPRSREVVVAIEKMVEQQVEASGITSDVIRLDGWRILDAIQEASESGAANE